MIKQSITFEDLEGNERTEDFYFNLNSVELAQYHIDAGGFEVILERLGNSEGASEAFKLFTDIILDSYGEKGEDGVSFVKEDDEGRPLSRKFRQHPAFGELATMLLQNENGFTIEFISGLFPSRHRAAIKEETARLAAEEYRGQEAEKAAGVHIRKVEDTELPRVSDHNPDVLAEVAPKTSWKDYTEEELLEMSREDFDKLIPSGGNVDSDLLAIAFHRRGLGK